MSNFNILAETKRVLAKNYQVADNYTAPALPKYPNQWLWDSCFAAIILSKIDPERAKNEIKTLLLGQDESGFIPSILLWKNRWINKIFPANLLYNGWKSRITQLPVIALAVEKIYDQTHDDKFLSDVLPKLKKYYLWLEKERDNDNDCLVSIIHPWESTDDDPAFGIGNNPIKVYATFYKLLWDQKRGLESKFNIENVMFNCLFAQGLRILGRWDKNFVKKADKVEQAILDLCYDVKENFFFDVSHKNSGHKHYRVKTISGLFPLVLDNIPKTILDSLVEKYLTNENEFWLPYPLPFVSKSEKCFDPGYHFLLWRGPTWVNTNWFLIKGLEKHGYTDVAKKMSEKTIEMVEKFGLWEMYHPITGVGMGQKDYTWSGLVLDLI